MTSPDPETRAARHAALGDPVRLAVVDELTRSDRSPSELGRILGVGSNLLAHHLDALERVGLVVRHRSSGDGRRRYVSLVPESLAELVPGRRRAPAAALFVCTHNSARSQLAAALWRAIARKPAESAGSAPASHVHPGAVAAADRAGLDLGGARPRRLDEVDRRPELVVTVCDRAHEELGADDWLHWSVPDPVEDPSPASFDETVTVLRERVLRLVGPGATS